MIFALHLQRDLAGSIWILLVRITTDYFRSKQTQKGSIQVLLFGVGRILARARVLITVGTLLTANRQNLLSAGSFSSGTAVDPRES